MVQFAAGSCFNYELFVKIESVAHAITFLRRACVVGDCNKVMRPKSRDREFRTAGSNTNGEAMPKIS